MMLFSHIGRALDCHCPGSFGNACHGGVFCVRRARESGTVQSVQAGKKTMLGGRSTRFPGLTPGGRCLSGENWNAVSETPWKPDNRWKSPALKD